MTRIKFFDKSVIQKSSAADLIGGDHRGKCITKRLKRVGERAAKILVCAVIIAALVFVQVARPQLEAQAILPLLAAGLTVAAAVAVGVGLTACGIYFTTDEDFLTSINMAWDGLIVQPVRDLLLKAKIVGGAIELAAEGWNGMIENIVGGYVTDYINDGGASFAALTPSTYIANDWRGLSDVVVQSTIQSWVDSIGFSPTQYGDIDIADKLYSLYLADRGTYPYFVVISQYDGTSKNNLCYISSFNPYTVAVSSASNKYYLVSNTSGTMYSFNAAYQTVSNTIPFTTGTSWSNFASKYLSPDTYWLSNFDVKSGMTNYAPVEYQSGAVIFSATTLANYTIGADSPLATGRNDAIPYAPVGATTVPVSIPATVTGTDVNTIPDVRTITATDIATDVAASPTVPEVPPSLPDLPDISIPQIIFTKKFPFSLPYDLYHAFYTLAVPPEPPQFQFTVPMHQIGMGLQDISLDVDLSQFSTVAAVCRWGFSLLFVIALILVTRKIMGAE